MKFRVQLANKLTRTNDGWAYQIVGALVLDVKAEKLSAVPLSRDGDEWADEIEASLPYWSDSYLNLMTQLYDRSSTVTSYSEAIDLTAKDAREAAEKAQIRLAS